MAKASKLLVKLILCLILQGVVVLSKSLSLYRDRPFVQHFDRKMVSKGYDRFIVEPNQRPRADEPANEKPSNEKPPNETPVSDEGKNKMGSFKIDDGDVIGGGVYEIKPDGIVDVDVKIKISPGASSPALCPAQPCPSEAPKEQTTKGEGGAKPENQAKTTAAANTSNKPGEKAPESKPESTESKEPEPSKEEAAKPENPKGEAPNKAKTSEDEKPEGSAEGAAQTTPSPLNTKGEEENAKPTTEGSEDKAKPKPDGSGEAPEASGDAATAVSDASQGPFVAMKQTKERNKIRLASKELPELNKLKEALSDAAANWAFNLRNGRRREYMERSRIHYTHQNFVPYYNIQY